jgi:hypothetical protein
MRTGTLRYGRPVYRRLRRSASSERPHRPYLNAPDGRIPPPFRSKIGHSSGALCTRILAGERRRHQNVFKSVDVRSAQLANVCDQRRRVAAVAAEPRRTEANQTRTETGRAHLRRNRHSSAARNVGVRRPP